jgi:hypothetical protein
MKKPILPGPVHSLYGPDSTVQKVIPNHKFYIPEYFQVEKEKVTVSPNFQTKK